MFIHSYQSKVLQSILAVITLVAASVITAQEIIFPQKKSEAGNSGQRIKKQLSDVEKQADLIDRYKQLLVKKPAQDWAFQKLFRIYLKRNNTQALVDEYKALVKESPEDSTPRIVLSRIYQELDQHEDALKTLKKLKDPGRDVLLILGKVYLANGKFDEATKSIRAAVDKSNSRDQRRKCYELLGTVYLKNKQKDKACVLLRLR